MNIIKKIFIKLTLYTLYLIAVLSFVAIVVNIYFKFFVNDANEITIKPITSFALAVQKIEMPEECNYNYTFPAVFKEEPIVFVLENATDSCEVAFLDLIGNLFNSSKDSSKFKRLAFNNSSSHQITIEGNKKFFNIGAIKVEVITNNNEKQISFFNLTL